MIAAVALLLGMSSCTEEWNNHYDSVSTTQGLSYNGTLMKAVTENANLSRFAQVLKATGYDKVLDNSQVFTVFAPTNTQLTDDQVTELITRYNKEKGEGVKDRDNTVIKEFIQNHIALYNYSVSPEMEDKEILMMNGKKMQFTKSAYSQQEYLTKNLLANNGVLFTIDKPVAYKPNLYEQLDADADLDSLKTFIYKYTINKLSTSESVPGGLVDGKINYLDSVTHKQNEMLGNTWLKADILNEDSTYWMLAPNNAQWKEMVEKYEKYYNYDKLIAERDSFIFTFPRYDIIEGTVFSKTPNKKIFETETAAENDSLMSTNSVTYKKRMKSFGGYNKTYNQYFDPYGTGGVLATAKVGAECSNGRMLKFEDKWMVNPKATFLRDIVMESEIAVDSLFTLSKENPESKNPDTASPEYVSVSADNKYDYYNKVSGHMYMTISPRNASRGGRFTNARFNVTNVLSNVKYDVYLVIAPGEAKQSSTEFVTEEDCMPTKLRVAIACNNENGVTYYMEKPKAATGIAQDFYVYRKQNVSYYKDTNNRSKGINTPDAKYQVDLVSTPHQMDTVKVGTYIFPTCSYKTAEAQVKVVISSNVSGADYDNGYRPTLRLDNILFVPRED